MLIVRSGHSVTISILVIVVEEIRLKINSRIVNWSNRMVAILLILRMLLMFFDGRRGAAATRKLETTIETLFYRIGGKM